MTKSTKYLALANVLLFSFILANMSSLSALADYNNSGVEEEQSEEKEKFVTTRGILSVGITQENYTGTYREQTKNSFIQGNYNDGYKAVDVDKSYGANISYAYEVQLNVAKFFNPYLGIAFTLGFPFSYQDKYVNVPVATTFSIKEKTTSSFTGNFLDLKLRLGNSFKIVKDVIDLNVYGTFGIGTTAFLSVNPNYFVGPEGNLVTADLPISLGFSYGYVFGGGADIIFVKHLLVGAYFEVREMKNNVFKEANNDESFSFFVTQGNIANYSNRTLGLKIGYVF